jgi:5'-nucleotidase
MGEQASFAMADFRIAAPVAAQLFSAGGTGRRGDSQTAGQGNTLCRTGLASDPPEGLVLAGGCRMILRLLIAAGLLVQTGSAWARRIVLSNDDGLTSNVKALYEALKADGHDVIVAVPCTNQSGMGAAIRFLKPLVALDHDCRNGAARAGDPATGAMKRDGLAPDYFYVDGTPVMSLLYGIDIVGVERWGAPPDLVLSGPNEGQNVGALTIASGTVGNVQYAGSRGIPAIALSAGLKTTGDGTLANPDSATVARLAAQLVKTLDARSGGKAVLPPGVALNVNFPDRLAGATWRLTRIGSYSSFTVRFARNIDKAAASRPGVAIQLNTKRPTPAQRDDEALVFQKDIAVSVMQIGYEPQPGARLWVRRHLRGFLRR